MTTRRGDIWIISGPRGVGKTRFCSNLVEKARKQGLLVKGVTCPAVFSHGIKTGIDVEDLSSQKRYGLAKAKRFDGFGTVTDHWDFDAEVMSMTNRLLADARDCDLVVLDELGPLEFKMGKGWQNGLYLIDHKDFDYALVVIRPELVRDAIERWPTARVIEIPPMLDEVGEKALQERIFTAAT
jgi:nucleoside-triphosphatase